MDVSMFQYNTVSKRGTLFSKQLEQLLYYRVRASREVL